MDTPCFILNYDDLVSNVECFENTAHKYLNALLAYSVKTNCMPWLIRFLYGRGWYLEVVSGQELDYVMALGVNPSRVIFNGPNKSGVDIKTVIEAGGIVNIDSWDDIDAISSSGVKGFGFGIRVNCTFDEEELSLEIGYPTSRFGLEYTNGDVEVAALKIGETGNWVNGLHLHISGKSRNSEMQKKKATLANEIIQKLKLPIEYVDLGGGFRSGGTHILEKSMQAISDSLKNNVRIVLEPGAAIIATALGYATKVVSVRTIRHTNFVTVDGSRSHCDPTFSNKRYKPLIVPLNSNLSRKIIAYQTICGCTCMERDRLFQLLDHHELGAGDIIYLGNLGAYTYALAPSFIIGKPCVYLYKDNQLSVIEPSHKLIEQLNIS